MACPQTLAGIAKDCASSMGGVAEVLLANRDDVTAITITDGKISAITMASAGTPPVSATFKKYAFRPNTSSMTSNWQVNAENGTRYVQTDLQMIFSRMETTKRVEISALALADLVAIVKDCNGKYWYLGYDNPLFLSGGDAQTGTARSDRNGYSTTLQDDSDDLPYEVAESIISGLLGA